MMTDDEKLAKKKSKKKDKKKDKKRKKHSEESTDTSNPKRPKILSPEDLHSSSGKEINLPSESKEKKKKSKKEDKKHKKDKKSKKSCDDSSFPDDNKCVDKAKKIKAAPTNDDVKLVGGRIVSFSAQDINHTKDTSQENSTTLLLFYQYIEPVLDEDGFQALLHHVQKVGDENGITGRMRVSHEGLNCTLTGSYEGIRAWCKSLREYEGGAYFSETEFKLTDDLPSGQAFPRLHAFKVEEIVNYGLAGMKAPSINMTGVHLDPKDYHEKMTEQETVIIDVRNHYEANIGKFQPPTNGAQYIDPMMRKSTEFPVWLDKPETKEMLRGKQVLMYCKYYQFPSACEKKKLLKNFVQIIGTGGVRCERASALLRTKMEKEEDTKALGIKGVCKYSKTKYYYSSMVDSFFSP